MPELTVETILGTPPNEYVRPLRTSGPALVLIFEPEAPLRIEHYGDSNAEHSALRTHFRDHPAVQAFLDSLPESGFEEINDYDDRLRRCRVVNMSKEVRP